MKTIHIFISIVLLSLVSFNLSAQNASDDEQQLKKIIKVKLRTIIEKFDGEYKGNVTFDEMNELDEDEFEIRGKVTYYGTYCGDVRADYKATFQADGSIQACINTKICNILTGSFIRWEWDCKGEKYSKDKYNIILKEANKIKTN